jgi:tetratricopeptide (TPR) repeat protein
MRLRTGLPVFLFLVVQLTTPTASAQTGTLTQTQLAELEEFIKKQMAAVKIPGLSIGYLKDDLIWAGGFGYADLENKFPARAESMYRLASVTKPMTATAILQLVEKGKINLDAEVQTYVPYFPKKNFPGTVRASVGLTEAGMSLLQAAAELYPTDAALYDSLGDFYNRKGVKDKAIEFYKKALETNPNYSNAENARAALKKLEN